MGNVVTFLVLHSFQRQDILFNILFKPDEIDQDDPMAGAQEPGEIQGQLFQADNHFQQVDIVFDHLNQVNNDLNLNSNPDLIIDPSKHEPLEKEASHKINSFCHISRVQTSGFGKASSGSSRKVIEKRIGHVAVWFANKMVVWGGYNDRSGRDHRYLSADKLWVFEPLSCKWSSQKGNERLVPVKDMPRGTSGATACLIDHQMFIFGGYTETGNVNTMYRVNLNPLRYLRDEQNDGEVLPQITFEQVCVSNPDVSPMACDKSVSWSYDGRLYIFGGYGYEPSSKLIRELPNNVKFYLDFAAEQSERGWNNQLACYDPLNNKWSFPRAKGDWPSPRAAHAAALVGSHVFVFGGRYASERMNDLWKLNMETMTWTQMHQESAKWPEGRSWHSLTAISSNELVLYGGLSRFRTPLGDCWVYSIPSNIWNKVSTNARIPRLWHTAIYSTVDDEILIYGGGFDDLFNHNLGDIYTNDLLSLRFSPKSLFKLSLDCVTTNIALSTGALTTLKKEIPTFLCKIIEQKSL